MNKWTKIVLFAVGCSLCAPWSFAEEKKLQVQQSDTIKATLLKQVGKKVKLILRSDKELIGTVVTVGEHVLHLSEISGSEFFDAIVNIEDINAVVIRVRDR